MHLDIPASFRSKIYCMLCLYTAFCYSGFMCLMGIYVYAFYLQLLKCAQHTAWHIRIKCLVV